MSRKNGDVIEYDFVSPSEASDEIDKIEAKLSITSAKIIPMPQKVPHCDCRDLRQMGTMSPTEVDLNGNCTRCGFATLMRVIGRTADVSKHGTYRAYTDHKCRCTECTRAYREQRAKNDAAYTARKKLKTTHTETTPLSEPEAESGSLGPASTRVG